MLNRRRVRQVVWDWNGTLLDDLDCCLGVTNQLLAEFGLPGLADVAAYRSVFGFPIIDYYAQLGFDTGPGGNFDAAAQRYIELYSLAARACQLHPGAREALAAVRDAGVAQVVISASQQQNLATQLAPFALDQLLDGSYGIADIYAASKLAVAERWLAASALDPAEVLFVGDSEHDFEIAHTLRAQCVLFAGGHHGRERLARLGVPLVHELAQVIDLVRAAN
ncbi:HAD family hydrolase [Propionicimonas sp.]|uniref:HAD family hydrolase n=1 Tax=Propionicimonas sp. TaxID=1955623 RepID=UPI0039E71430